VTLATGGLQWASGSAPDVNDNLLYLAAVPNSFNPESAHGIMSRTGFAPTMMQLRMAIGTLQFGAMYKRSLAPSPRHRCVVANHF
jgi:hypothetical protein